MKRYILDFIHRGLGACGFGPIVLAVLYMILHKQGLIETVTVHEVCLGIVSLTLLAFIAGGMNVVYQMERLPLMIAILIHGIVLYISYLITYLVNDWMDWGTSPVLVFTGIFIVGYLLIWLLIYYITQRSTARVNRILEMKQQQLQD